MRCSVPATPMRLSARNSRAASASVLSATGTCPRERSCRGSDRPPTSRGAPALFTARHALLQQELGHWPLRKTSGLTRTWSPALMGLGMWTGSLRIVGAAGGGARLAGTYTAFQGHTQIPQRVLQHSAHARQWTHPHPAHSRHCRRSLAAAGWPPSTTPRASPGARCRRRRAPPRPSRRARRRPRARAAPRRRPGAAAAAPATCRPRSAPRPGGPRLRPPRPAACRGACPLVSGEDQSVHSTRCAKHPRQWSRYSGSSCHMLSGQCTSNMCVLPTR